MLPKTAVEILNGGIYRQRIRCGKRNCRCANGERHIGYYFFTRSNGKLRKKYIRKDQLENFTKIVIEAFVDRKMGRWRNQLARTLSKRHLSTLRDQDPLLVSLKRELANGER
jgi:hypothetical protein